MKTYIQTLSLLVIMIFVGVGCGEAKKPLTPEEQKAELQKNINDKKKQAQDIAFEVKELEKALLKLDPNYKQKEEERKKKIVSTQTPFIKNFEQLVDFQGQVQTKGEFKASAEMGGVLKELLVKEGDRVSAGQLVGKNDAETMRRQIDELQTRLNLAKDVFGRRAKLWEQNIGSEIEYLKAKNDVEALEKSISTIRSQMSKVNIYAPNSGLVDMILVKQGEMTGPGTPIFTIVNTNNLQVVADVPEDYLKTTRRGDRVKVTIPALEIEQTGRITKIGAFVNANNRTFPIEIAISNKGGKVKPNLMATVELKEFSKKDAIVLPTSLILNDLEGDYVYVVSQDDSSKTIAQKLKVETGETVEGETLIMEGLTGEEQIISEGNRLVSDGDLVKVLNVGTGE